MLMMIQMVKSTDTKMKEFPSLWKVKVFFVSYINLSKDELVARTPEVINKI